MEEIIENQPNNEGLENTDGMELQTSEKTSEISQVAPNEEQGSTKLIETMTAQEILDWQKDARFEKMWKKDPNQLYKSYRSLESMKQKEFDPLKKRFDGLNKTLQQYQVDIDGLPEVLKDYADIVGIFQDKEHPLSQFADFYNDPAYGPQVKGFIEELKTKKLQEMYPGYTREQVKEISELKERTRRLEEEKQRREFDVLTQQYQQEVVNNLEKVRSTAKEYGIAFEGDMEAKLLDYCMKEKVEPKHIMFAFREMFQDQLDKAYEDKMQRKALEKVAKNKSNVVVGAKSSATQTTGMTAREKLQNAASKFFGT